MRSTNYTNKANQLVAIHGYRKNDVLRIPNQKTQKTAFAWALYAVMRLTVDKRNELFERLEMIDEPKPTFPLQKYRSWSSAFVR